MSDDLWHQVEWCLLVMLCVLTGWLHVGDLWLKDLSSRRGYVFGIFDRQRDLDEDFSRAYW